MLNLIKLEVKKFKLEKNLIGVLITNLCLSGLMVMMGVIGRFEEELMFTSYPLTITLIDTLTRGTFIIYSSVILAKLVIEEYNNKTMNLMFMYPIKRKKIFMAKFIIVVGFAFINIIVSDVVLILVLSTIDQFYDIIVGYFTIQILVDEAPMLIINAAIASIMTLIPLYFGMKKMSVSITIVAAFILICLVCSNSNGFSISSILPVTLSIAAVGLLVGRGILKKVESNDIV